MSTVGWVPRIVVLLGVSAAACGSDAAAPSEEAEPAALAVVAGDEQTGSPGAELPEPLVVSVRDTRQRPVRDQLVVFQVTEGGGTLYAGTGLSDGRGRVQDWWTLGPAPGAQTVEARAVDPRTGEKLVFATFHATATDDPPPAADPLAGDWYGTRPEGTEITYRFTALGRVEANPHTGAAAAAYAGRYTEVSPPAQPIDFTAWLEGTLLYWGSTSRGELVARDTLEVWSAGVERFPVVRR